MLLQDAHGLKDSLHLPEAIPGLGPDKMQTANVLCHITQLQTNLK